MMPILAYYAVQNAVAADKPVRHNSAKSVDIRPAVLSKWDGEFVKILDELSAAKTGTASEETIRRVLDGFNLKAKQDGQHEVDESLLVIGRRHVELYRVSTAREGESRFQKETIPNNAAFPSLRHSQNRGEAGWQVAKFFDEEAVAHFLRSSLGWLPSGERDRSHVEAFRQAHAFASERELAGVVLHRLFQQALWLFEKVRLETEFFRSPGTLAEILVELAGKIFGGLKQRTALLVGHSNEMPGAATALRHAGIGALYFSPSTPDQNAETKIVPAMNRRNKITVSEEPADLSFADVLLLFDGSAGRLKQRPFLLKLMAARNNAPLMLVDLTDPAAPSDGSKGSLGNMEGREGGTMAGNSIHKMYNLFFFRRRDLERMIEQNVPSRLQVEREVSGWINQEVEQFYQWLNSEDRFHFGFMVGRSRQMQRVFELIARIAQNDITVLIEGESGTGKELVARAIHQSSHRSRQPFVVVNCGAIPENLLESELFGHVRGAFTGALNNKRGLFEEANGGTIFLDEIGEMSPALQVKLLRFLQDGEIKRVGSNAVMQLDVRVLTATNRNLQQMVNDGKFRSDLYYRLNVIQITLPPLRERPEDVSILAIHFLYKYARRMRKPLTAISPEAMQRLREYEWPGNVRELENMMERAVALSSDATLGMAELPDNLRQTRQSRALARPTLAEVERQYILETVTACHDNYDEAARVLGIGRTTLWRKLKIYLGENGK